MNDHPTDATSTVLVSGLRLKLVILKPLSGESVSLRRFCFVEGLVLSDLLGEFLLHSLKENISELALAPFIGPTNEFIDVTALHHRRVDRLHIGR